MVVCIVVKWLSRCCGVLWCMLCMSVMLFGVSMWYILVRLSVLFGR